MPKADSGLIFTISGPSGSGKDTVANHLIETMGNMGHVATATTRAPRAGEQHGVHYYFLSEEDFLQKVKDGAFVEWINGYSGKYYGTLKSVIEDEVNSGKDVLSDITIHGVRAMKEFLPKRTVSLLIMPPSFAILEDRLRKRKAQTGEDEKALELRLELLRGRLQEDLDRLDEKGYKFQTPDIEGASPKDFDHIIINENLEDTLKKAEEIVKFERLNRSL